MSYKPKDDEYDFLFKGMLTLIELDIYLFHSTASHARDLKT